MLGIYTLAATIFTGWFVPNIARQISAYRQKRYMQEYFSELNKLENTNEKGEKVGFIKKQIIESYARGKISESHYKLLMEKISEREKCFGDSNQVELQS